MAYLVLIGFTIDYKTKMLSVIPHFLSLLWDYFTSVLFYVLFCSLKYYQVKTNIDCCAFFSAVLDIFFDLVND